MKTKTTRWDAAEHVKTKADMAAYIACALEEGDIARAQRMTAQTAQNGGGEGCAVSPPSGILCFL